MSITRSNTQVLRSILLLSLGDISASILAVVDTARCLPFGFLRKLSNGLDGIADGQEMHESNCLLANDLDGVNRAEFAKILTQLILGNILRQVAKVDVSGSP